MRPDDRDLDDEIRPAWLQQIHVAERIFVSATGDPYALVPAITLIIQELSPSQPVERAATLEDVRVEVLGPQRLNAFVVSGFAGVALLIAVVGVAGVLAFSASARTREFGVRLAMGVTPRHLLLRVLLEGASSLPESRREPQAATRSAAWPRTFSGAQDCRAPSRSSAR